MNEEFWSGKRVFLTGHTGFKGSWLSLWLQTAGVEVTGYALEPPTTPSLFDSARVVGGMRSIVSDVRDANALARAVDEQQPDVIIHMAAQSVVRRSYADPAETFATNVMGTVNVLDAARACPSVRAVVIVTSDKCYENQEWVWGYREGDRLGGHDPYSSSKACAELVTSAYRRSFFEGSGDRKAGIATVRAGNVIGGGDWTPDQLVPDVIRAFHAGKSIRLRHPEAVRPWQFVLDPLRGYLMVAEELWARPAAASGAWNFGPSDSESWPVREIVSRLSDLWGRDSRWEADPGPHPHEAALLKLDASKARHLLRWVPRLGTADALAWTVEWYRGWAEGADVRALCLAQIARFQKGAPA